MAATPAARSFRTAAPSGSVGLCPSCATVSRRIHSRCRRRVTDLPLSGRVVELLVIARRFRCDVVLCGRHISPTGEVIRWDLIDTIPMIGSPAARRRRLGGRRGARLFGGGASGQHNQCGHRGERYYGGSHPTRHLHRGSRRHGSISHAMPRLICLSRACVDQDRRPAYLTHPDTARQTRCRMLARTRNPARLTNSQLIAIDRKRLAGLQPALLIPKRHARL